MLLLLQLGGAYLCWLWLKSPAVTALNKPAVAMSLFALFALTLFLLGKYSSGLARLENNSPGAPRFELSAARRLHLFCGGRLNRRGSGQVFRGLICTRRVSSRSSWASQPSKT